MWAIQDWTGRRLFPDRTFSTFEDGWEFIRGQFPDPDDWDELFVIELGGDQNESQGR